MEHLAIVVPMIMVPLTLLALYGVIWPSPVDDSTRTLQAGKRKWLVSLRQQAAI